MERGVKVNGISEMERALWKGDDDYRIQDAQTTPFYAAIEAQNQDLAMFLLELHEQQEQQEREGQLDAGTRARGSGLDVGRLMDEDRTILQRAVFCELPRVAKALLVDYGADLFAKDERGHCALCTAAFKCHVELLTIFLTHCREQGRLREALEKPCGYLADARCYQSLLFHFPSDERMSRQEEVTVARTLVQVRGERKRGKGGR